MLLAVLLCPALFRIQCGLECKTRRHAETFCLELLNDADLASCTAGDTAGDDW